MLIIWTYVPISSKIIQRSIRYVSSVVINMIPDGSEIIIYQKATKHNVVLCGICYETVIQNHLINQRVSTAM